MPTNRQTESYQVFGQLLGRVYGQEVAELVVRDMIGASDGRAIQLAADAQGHRHLLVPVAEDYAITPQGGDSLEIREFLHPAQQARMLDLVCTSDKLAIVFATLVDSALDRVGSDLDNAATVVQGVVSEWRTLLRAAGQLSEEAERGLFGELWVLRDLAATNPVAATASWQGPLGATHDFVTTRGDIEVKSVSHQALTVVISSLEQLDPPTAAPLALVQVRVRSSETGATVSDLVNELVRMGCPRAEITDRVLRVGMLPEQGAEERRFEVDGQNGWEVGEHFPGLRRSELPEVRLEAVTRVSYTLDLNGAPGRMTDHDLDAYRRLVMTA